MSVKIKQYSLNENEFIVNREIDLYDAEMDTTELITDFHSNSVTGEMAIALPFLNDDGGIKVYNHSPNNSYIQPVLYDDINNVILSHPFCSAWDSSRNYLYICDTGNNRIVPINHNSGSLLKIIEGLTFPHAIIAGVDNGEIYVKYLIDDTVAIAHIENYNLKNVYMLDEQIILVDNIRDNFLSIINSGAMMAYDYQRKRFWFINGDIISMVDNVNHQLFDFDLSSYLGLSPSGILGLDISQKDGYAYVSYMENSGEYKVIVIFRDNNEVLKSFSLIKGENGFEPNMELLSTTWTWGTNQWGQLGNGTVGVSQSTPVEVLNHTFVQASAGGGFVLARKSDGETWAWGSNSNGKLGIGVSTTFDISTPVKIDGHSFIQVSAGGSHGISIDSNGEAWAWGSNLYGRLGIGTVDQESTPVKISGHSFVKISAGDAHSLAIDSDGKTWAWGHNQYGKLGIGSTDSKSTPVEITNHTFYEISAGTNYSLAIDSNGKTWAWGGNANGELGIGSTTSQSNPVEIVNHSFVKVSAGYRHSLAIDSNGEAWAWGANTAGQLGTGSTTWRSTPVHIANHTFNRISAGQEHSLAIDGDGTAWVWGENTSGKLGIGSTTSKSTPVKIENHTFREIAAYKGHNSLAISFITLLEET